MTRYWCERAWLAGPTTTDGVLLEVEEQRIVHIATGVPVAPGGARSFRGLTLPGLANAHSHLFHRVLRSRTQRGSGSFWTWRDDMYASVDTLDPESYYALARAVFAEMVMAGITAVGEFHYVHHGRQGARYSDENAMGRAVVAGAHDAGIRLTLIDTCYLAGGIKAPLNETQRRFSDGSIDGWVERASARDDLVSPTVRLGAAIHSIRAVPVAAMPIVAATAQSRAWPVHAHVSEQAAENEACRVAYGCSPLALLHRSGVLGPHFSAIHATHLDADDITLLGSHQATVVACPTTERDLADGIGPFAELNAAGCGLAIGTDSHAVIDAFEEARGIEMNARLGSGRRGLLPTATLLGALTVRGHRSIGWSDGGSIKIGGPADFITVDMASVRTAGAADDLPLETAVFAASAADVTDVVIGGEHVVRAGRHTRIDAPAELAAWTARFLSQRTPS